MGREKRYHKIRQINHYQVLSVIFLLFIFIVGSVNFFTSIFNVGKLLANDNENSAPQAPKSAKIVTEATSQRKSNTIITTINKALDMREDIERNLFKFSGPIFINKSTYINLNGLTARIMGQRYMNQRVKLDTGHITSISNPTDVTLAATQLIKLNERQKNSGKDFLFVLAPCKIPKYEDIVPLGYTDYANQNADELVKLLRLSQVAVLDLRDEMIKDEINFSEAFFLTDHHWKPETGFWAYTKIVDYLTQENILSPIASKYTNTKAYNFENYKDWYLGSDGKRTGIYFAGVDDFTLITPKFDTDILYEIPAKNISRHGSFSDAIIDYSRIKKDYFLADSYYSYAFANTAYGIYRNEKAPCQIKVLTIHDSFARLPNAFLSLAVSSHDTWDMRDYTQNFEEYYLEYRPDLIIVQVNARGVNSNNTTYDFFNDLPADTP